MLHTQIIQLVGKYRALAPRAWQQLPGTELPLLPEDALRFADELRALGVAIMGLDGWFYVEGDPNRVCEDPYVHFYVGDVVLAGHDAVERSVTLIKEYILNHFPPTHQRVSFTLAPYAAGTAPEG